MEEGGSVGYGLCEVFALLSDVLEVEAATVEVGEVDAAVVTTVALLNFDTHQLEICGLDGGTTLGAQKGDTEGEREGRERDEWKR